MNRRDMLRAMLGIVASPALLFMPTNPVAAAAANAQLYDLLAIGPTTAAEDAVNDFIRCKMREEGFFRRIMPPTAI